MKKIEIKFDPTLGIRAAAIYISGKLINLSLDHTVIYFRICGSRIDREETFIAFLKAVACETDEELKKFRDKLEPYISWGSKSYRWKETLEDLKQEIANADDSKIRASGRTVAVVYKDKLALFIKDKVDQYYYADGVKISKSKGAFLSILKAALCETAEELEIIIPTLDLVDENWKEKAKKIRECLTDDLFLEKYSVSMPPFADAVL